MVLEVIAVGVVHGVWGHGLVRDDPPPVSAVNEQPVQLRHDFRLLDKKLVDARDVDVLQAVAFHPFTKRGGQHIDLPDGVFGMLGGCTRQVGHGVAGRGKGGTIVAPGPPTFNGEEGQDNHEHKAHDELEGRSRFRRGGFSGAV
ncbi:hypothetical protein D3C86_1772160 [compost metagenome]